jgi:hypothetical protein
MPDRLAAVIWREVLFGDASDVFDLFVLGE